MKFNLNTGLTILALVVAAVSAYFTWQMRTREVLIKLENRVAELEGKPSPDSSIPAEIPADAVVAVTSEDCPDGWQKYGKAEGRFVIGVGQGELSVRLGSEEEGGEEEVELSIDHMPMHAHATALHAAPSDNRGWGRGGSDKITVSASYNQAGSDGGHFLTSERGEGSPHNNMPPYIALRFCQRER